MKKGMMKAIMGSCKEATFWMAKSEEQKLGFIQKMKLWLHLRFCEICRNFQKQSQAINHAATTLHSTESLSEGAKIRIEKQLLEQKNRENG